MALLGAKKSTAGTLKLKAAAMEKAIHRSLRTSRYQLTEDVKKGHFSVLAIDDGNVKKYIVPLCYLNDPSFLRLLEKAVEEFGFEHEGALCIPCGWNELDDVLSLDRAEATSKFFCNGLAKELHNVNVRKSH